MKTVVISNSSPHNDENAWQVASGRSQVGCIAETAACAICGVCPEAHHMAATKALDALYHVEPSSAMKKLGEMFYMAFYVTDHTTHFYALGGPDFVVGPDAPKAERNLLGVIHKVGVEVGKQVSDCHMRNHHVIKMLGGRGVHPMAGMPGGQLSISITTGTTMGRRRVAL